MLTQYLVDNHQPEFAVAGASTERGLSQRSGAAYSSRTRPERGGTRSPSFLLPREEFTNVACPRKLGGQLVDLILINAISGDSTSVGVGRSMAAS